MTINEIKKQFDLSEEQIRQIAYGFTRAIEAGLKCEESPLLMIPSYIGKPNGTENGRFIAVDMGGTNLRVGRFQINHWEVIKEMEIKVPLRDPNKEYDYTTSETTGEDLFDFIATQVGEVALIDEELLLGHTFSFSTKQKGINDAVLLSWSKEIEVQGVEGENPNILLATALERQGIQTKPCALINDTVGTLLVAAMNDKNANIGSIVGTGHNTCYLEPKHPLTGEAMIVNMEAANFDWDLPFTKYDKQLDQKSQKPGRGRLEKMVSGAYLGEVLRLVLVDLVYSGSLFQGNEHAARVLSLKNAVDTKMITEFIEDRDKTCGLFSCSETEAACVQSMAKMVMMRAARIVAGTYLGTILHLDPELRKKHSIGIDGSVYEKLPGFKEEILQALIDVIGIRTANIQLSLVKDGSGAGAAIAAATTMN